jgi:hypothetical protein
VARLDRGSLVEHHCKKKHTHNIYPRIDTKQTS